MRRIVKGGICPALWAFVLTTVQGVSEPAGAAQRDLVGPAGSVSFGTSVAVLPNGNIVVADPDADAPIAGAGAVHLYTPDGALISTLTGGHAQDHVGSGGITVLANGNIVVASPRWNPASAAMGAATWVDRDLGLPGVVTADNSLIGLVGDADLVNDFYYIVVTGLASGNGVIASPGWSNGDVVYAGAVTWFDGSRGVTGEVSADRSLVGTHAHDSIGAAPDFLEPGVVAFANGNYVVASPGWDDGTTPDAGAVTWGDGSSGASGVVSGSNSLIGSSSNDRVGFLDQRIAPGVTDLGNGHAAVASPAWSRGNLGHIGAVTWISATAPSVGPVSPQNSLIGSSPGDYAGDDGVTRLAHGDYVVASSRWSRGGVSGVGAVTWCSGSGGTVGEISDANSLTGVVADDRVGGSGVAALVDGNYVVGSFAWHHPDSGARFAGAATWATGFAATAASVTPANSLVGTHEFDGVGGAVAALPDGGYVVLSPGWGDGVSTHLGAVTWNAAGAPRVGAVSSANSLVGVRANDTIGGGGVTALGGAAYVVNSPGWWNGSAQNAGAVTRLDGDAAAAGVVSAENSLVGTHAQDAVGSDGIVVLDSGAYIVVSTLWNDGNTRQVGAVTRGDGHLGVSGAVSASNSVVGSTEFDRVGYPHVDAVDRSHYAAFSANWNNAALPAAGAVSLLDGAVTASGRVGPANGVVGTTANGGSRLAYAYDGARRRLVVGRPADGVVSLYTPERVFADGFEAPAADRAITSRR